MPFSYLGGQSWHDISRDERFFCAELFQHVRRDVARFVAWLRTEAPIPLKAKDGWEVGFEVCFFRDLLFADRRRSARREGFSTKRTFDLCLFSEEELVIVEAKVRQGFDATQCDVFAGDAANIRKALRRDDFPVHSIALASSRCFEAYAKHGTVDLASCFQAQVTWQQMYALYREPLFLRADELYGC